MSEAPKSQEQSIEQLLDKAFGYLGLNDQEKNKVNNYLNLNPDVKNNLSIRFAQNKPRIRLLIEQQRGIFANVASNTILWQYIGLEEEDVKNIVKRDFDSLFNKVGLNQATVAIIRVHIKGNTEILASISGLANKFRIENDSTKMQEAKNYLTYLAGKPTPPQTFREWQKNSSSAPMAPQTTIITPSQPPSVETPLTPEQITQFRNYVTCRFIFEEPGGQIPLADAMKEAGFADLSKFIDFLIKNTKYNIGKVGEDNLKKELFKLRVESTPAVINLSEYQLRN